MVEVGRLLELLANMLAANKREARRMDLQHRQIFNLLPLEPPWRKTCLLKWFRNISESIYIYISLSLSLGEAHGKHLKSMRGCGL